VEKEIPGFIGNRLQYAMLREALAIVRSGAASPEAVDTVMKASLGRRYASVGPLETADLGGLDTFLTIASHLMPELAKDEDVLELMRIRVEAGDTGLRSGKGFYPWPPERADQVIKRRNADLLRRRLADLG
jgi:3-hydroxybutyryl-CoA dehydrogenase